MLYIKKLLIILDNERVVFFQTVGSVRRCFIYPFCLSIRNATIKESLSRYISPFRSDEGTSFGKRISRKFKRKEADTQRA